MIYNIKNCEQRDTCNFYHTYSLREKCLLFMRVWNMDFENQKGMYNFVFCML